MISPEIRRLQYLNDLITQTLEVIQQRSMGAGTWQPYAAQFGFGAQPFTSPYFTPHAQWTGAPFGTPYPQHGHLPFGAQYGTPFTGHWGTPVTPFGLNPPFGQNGTHLPFQPGMDRTGVNPVTVS